MIYQFYFVTIVCFVCSGAFELYFLILLVIVYMVGLLFMRHLSFGAFRVVLSS